MRRLIQIVEQASAGSYYDPSALWLHGGPATLVGGHFRRGARNGRDMGGLFFTKESPEGWRYAAGYAVARYPGQASGVYLCRIHLAPNAVLDFTNPAHRRRVAEVMDAGQFKALEAYAADGHLPWFTDPATQVAMEQILRDAGFGGVVLAERKAGKGGAEVLSVCVFDPAHVEIIGFVPKAEAIERASGRG